MKVKEGKITFSDQFIKIFINKTLNPLYFNPKISSDNCCNVSLKEKKEREIETRLNIICLNKVYCCKSLNQSISCCTQLDHIEVNAIFCTLIRGV